MITISCSNGDIAEAPDAEGALLAGRTLYDEALSHARSQRRGTLPLISFYDHEGVLIRSTTDRTELEGSSLCERPADRVGSDPTARFARPHTYFPAKVLAQHVAMRDSEIERPKVES